MDMRVRRTDRGLEVLIDGKLHHIYQGSQDVRSLYKTLNTKYRSIGRQLERDQRTNDWHDRIAAGTLPNSGFDAFVTILTAALRRHFGG